MKRFIQAVRRFFLPPDDAKVIVRILPLFVVAFVVILFFAFGTYAWEESNEPEFCGTTCHTMPPQYVTYQESPHTNVICEDCHMGRDRLNVMVGRKVSYSWQTGTAMLLNNYEYPIYAENMIPARAACENCHKPEKFSTDKLVEIKHFAENEENTPTSTFLVVKTGGGTKRQGLGYGIHWHIENPVHFYATDSHQQNIPYVVVTNLDGSKTEYIDVESGLDPSTIKPEQLQEMDCITCHNRTAHMVESPDRTVDDLLARNLISPEIPEIKKKSVEVLTAEYATYEEAMDGIASLKTYYQDKPVDPQEIEGIVTTLAHAYRNTNFLDQKMNWQTHPNDLAHKDSPGCFRCHDGKHLVPEGMTSTGSAPATATTIRLECNLCHSIPVVTVPNQLTSNLELSKGFEPESHKNPNWITLHRDLFNDTCEGCHTVEDPGGTSNTSFCSNSVCHGANWKFAGFDAPKLRILLADQIKAMAPEPTATPAEGSEQPPTSGPVTYATVLPMLEEKCGSCHGDAGMKDLNLLSYETTMQGGESGPVVVPNDPENSLLVKIQSDSSPHFGQFSAEELELIKQWILNGAAEQ